MQRFVHLSEYYKLFSHPLRLGVVHLLAENKELSIKQLAKELGVTDGTLSQHMARLRHLKVIEVVRRGHEANYKLVHPGIIKVCQSFEEYYKKTLRA